MGISVACLPACLSIYLPSHHCCRISDTIEMDADGRGHAGQAAVLANNLAPSSPFVSPIFERWRTGDQHLNTAAAAGDRGEQRARDREGGGRLGARCRLLQSAPWGPFLGVTTDARFRLTVVVVVLIQVKCFSSGGRRNGKRTLNHGDGLPSMKPVQSSGARLFKK